MLEIKRKTKINFYLLSMMLALIITLTSCENQNDNEIYDALIGRTWVGDLGFTFDNYAVESGITFRGNDFAVDEQYYFGGGRATTLDVRWWISHGNLYLDYGSYLPFLEIRNIYVGYSYLDGDFYSDGRYIGRIQIGRAHV